MSKNYCIRIAIVFWLMTSMFSGCMQSQNGSYTTEEETCIEATSQMLHSDTNEIGHSNDKIVNYYDTFDPHMQSMYDSFIACEWKEIIELLHEFSLPKESRVGIYETPMEGISLIIEYMPEVSSWQAYLGENDGEQKNGKGVMVSARQRGYVSEGIYAGEWKENMPNGKGILTNSTSDIEYLFVSTFSDGKFDSEVQIYVLETPGLYVEWETLDPRFYIDASWTCADMIFEEGMPIPLEIETVDEFIQISEWTEHELSYLELENDGQYYYRVMGDRNAFILSIGVNEPAEGYRSSLLFCYGYFYDISNQEGTYGVPCYSTNAVTVY